MTPTEDTPIRYFFFTFFSVILNGLICMYTIFRQYNQLSCESQCICLPKVYSRIGRRCDYERLRSVSIQRLRVDLAETFFCKLLVPTLVLYYGALPRMWMEASFFAERIAIKGQESIVQTLFFATFLCTVHMLSGWPFSLYRHTQFDDCSQMPTLLDFLVGDVFMKFPKSLQLPRYLFWVLAWSRLRHKIYGPLPWVWLVETAYLIVSYEIVEMLVNALALCELPFNVLSRERCYMDLNMVKTYQTLESMAVAKIYIFRSILAFPVSLFYLPFSGDELMSLCLRFMALVEGGCIINWRALERIQAAVLYYLIHCIVGEDELMIGLGLGGPHPQVLRWIVIDYFIYPPLKTIMNAIRHYYNHQSEFAADAKTRCLGYDVALEAAIGKMGMFQERFPIEDPIYEVVFKRTPGAVHRIERLMKCPLAE